MATATETVSFSNISATTAAFTLRGGKYGMGVTATFGGGSVKLQVLLPDNSTFISVSAGTDFTAAGYGPAIDLPSGQYRLTVATATAIFAWVSRIPT